MNNEYLVNKECMLLDYLKDNIKGSKNNIKNLLSRKMVTVNNKVISKYDYKLRVGDKINVGNTRIEMNNLKDVNIIYEDNDIIVVSKPSGILTIASLKEKDRTLYNMVSTYVKSKNKNNKIFIVHRLDKDTSGLIVFAKNEKIKNLLQEKWNENTIRKYSAIVVGKTKEKEILKNYLKESKTLETYIANDGILAITKYKRIDFNDKYSLLDIEIETGKKNQIRVQLSNIGHSIVGDCKYGLKDYNVKRLMLHAYYLEFVNPVSKKNMVFEIDNPKIFHALMKK